MRRSPYDLPIRAIPLPTPGLFFWCGGTFRRYSVELASQRQTWGEGKALARVPLRREARERERAARKLARQAERLRAVAAGAP